MLFLLGLKRSLVMTKYISTLPFEVFVKIAALAASLTLHKQDLELPRYCACLGGKHVIQHVHFFFLILLSETMRFSWTWPTWFLNNGIKSTKFNESSHCFVRKTSTKITWSSLNRYCNTNISASYFFWAVLCSFTWLLLLVARDSFKRLEIVTHAVLLLFSVVKLNGAAGIASPLLLLVKRASLLNLNPSLPLRFFSNSMCPKHAEFLYCPWPLS